MKKVYFLLLTACCCSLSLLAELYGLLINGTTKLEATPVAEKDAQGREQFKVSCGELKQGDKVVIADGSDTSNNAAKRSGGPGMRM